MQQNDQFYFKSSYNVTQYKFCHILTVQDFFLWIITFVIIDHTVCGCQKAIVCVIYFLLEGTFKRFCKLVMDNAFYWFP